MNTSGKWKPNPVILVRLARAFYENESLKTSHLHSASRTRWTSFVKHMDWLKNKNYVEHKMDRNGNMHISTESGKKLFVKLLELQEHLE